MRTEPEPLRDVLVVLAKGVLVFAVAALVAVWLERASACALVDQPPDRVRERGTVAGVDQAPELGMVEIREADCQGGCLAPARIQRRTTWASCESGGLAISAVQTMRYLAVLLSSAVTRPPPPGCGLDSAFAAGADIDQSPARRPIGHDLIQAARPRRGPASPVRAHEITRGAWISVSRSTRTTAEVPSA